jgi:uncharacterized protein with HEPN domain
MRDAIIRRFEIIGEAASNISEKFNMSMLMLKGG